MKTSTCSCQGNCGNPHPESCAEFEGKLLCYDCWHKAREATPPYHVRRKSNPGSDFQQCCGVPAVYTYAEAVRRSAELNLGSDKDWEPVPASDWFGERISHPGYMARRRAAVMAEHPEYDR
jgi:hypothetical protein